MAPRKTERLLNLTIMLLSSRRYVPRERIREVVEGYHGLTEESFLRMFERDKDELRQLGIPIEMGSNDAYFDDEQGYRISRRDYELPAVEFTPIEATVLGLAATVWQQASAADETTHALAKLRAAGIEPDASRLTALAPRLSAREDAFTPLWQAVIGHQLVEFNYRDSDERRVIEPWRLAFRSNAWYLLGHDRSRQASRLFKLARITSPVKLLGKPDAFDLPDDLAIDEHFERLSTPANDVDAVLAIRGDRAPALRRRGRPCESPVELPAGFAAHQVPLAWQAAVAEIAGHGPDVIVLEPAELRADVLDHLRGVLRVHDRGDGGGAR